MWLFLVKNESLILFIDILIFEYNDYSQQISSLYELGNPLHVMFLSNVHLIIMIFNHVQISKPIPENFHPWKCEGVSGQHFHSNWF